MVLPTSAGKQLGSGSIWYHPLALSHLARRPPRRGDLGPVTVVGELNFVGTLPKTRSRKIMRRVFKAVILDRDPGDITTIEEEGSVDEAGNT